MKEQRKEAPARKPFEVPVVRRESELPLITAGSLDLSPQPL